MNKTKYPQDYYQPDTKFKEEFLNEEHKQAYLRQRDNLMKKQGWKKILFSFEE